MRIQILPLKSAGLYRGAAVPRRRFFADGRIVKMLVIWSAARVDNCEKRQLWR